MPLNLATPTPLDYFAALVRSDDAFPLLEAAACLAQDAYPQLDVQQVLCEVDELARRLRQRVAADAPVVQRLRVLNQFFFGALGFACNVNHYHAPENSYLNDVLRTRKGIPVSLAVLWLELAQGLGLKARGVAFPGHFLVKVLLSEGQVVMDPVNGQSLSREDLLERLAPLPQETRWREEGGEALAPFLRSATAREMLARMLRNLKEVHRQQEDWPRALAVLQRLTLLLPQDAEQLRDRGLAHAACGHVAQAVADLQGYLERCPQAPDTQDVLDGIRSLKKLD